MLYCPKCQSLQQAGAQVCEICQEPVLREPVPEDFVLFAYELSESDAGRLCGTLSDAEILFEHHFADQPGHTILVRFDSLQRACDLARGIGLELLGDFAELDGGTEFSPEKETEPEEPEHSRKKMVSRIILFAFFIGIVWAVVALSDTLIAFVKGLFTGG